MGWTCPAAQRVTSVVLTRDEVPAATKKAMIRSSLMTMAALGGMGLLLIALVDGWLTGRRDPEPEDLVVEDETEHPRRVPAPRARGRAVP